MEACMCGWVLLTQMGRCLHMLDRTLVGEL